MGPEEVYLQPRLCDRVICAEEGSELDDVGNKVYLLQMTLLKKELL